MPERKYMKSTPKLLVNFILDQLPYEWRDSILSVKRFNLKKKSHPERQLFVMFVDGKGFHDGLCDRFKGIVSLFHYCLCKNIPFKLNYTYPFDLSDYLLPNEYDWKLSSSDQITYHLCEAKYINLIGDASAQRLVTLKTNRQVHAYANRDITDELNKSYHTDYQWGELFRKLFKPTEELNSLICNYKQKTGEKYICAQFRFQNLLGDFKESGCTELQGDKKTELIDKCRRSILDLQQAEECKRILVTSDSFSFLETLSGMNDIYAFPEKIVHIDNATGESYHVYMKSFIDFYLLSEGLKIFSIGTKEMYKSEFPLYAAKLNNITFEQIRIK
jgi:hypothetical protein